MLDPINAKRQKANCVWHLLQKSPQIRLRLVGYKYTNTNTQIHKYTNTQIKIHKYKYTNANTQIQFRWQLLIYPTVLILAYIQCCDIIPPWLGNPFEPRSRFEPLTGTRETESGIIDPLVSKQPEKISNKKKLQKNFKKTSQRKKKIIIKKNIEKSTNEGRYQAGPKGPEPARRAATQKSGPGGPLDFQYEV